MALTFYGSIGDDRNDGRTGTASSELAETAEGRPVARPAAASGRRPADRGQPRRCATLSGFAARNSAKLIGGCPATSATASLTSSSSPAAIAAYEVTQPVTAQCGASYPARDSYASARVSGW